MESHITVHVSILHVLYIYMINQLVVYIMLSTYMIHTAVRGFHVNGTFWSPHVGDLLATARETLNVYDRHAIAVLSRPVIVVY